MRVVVALELVPAAGGHVCGASLCPVCSLRAADVLLHAADQLPHGVSVRTRDRLLPGEHVQSLYGLRDDDLPAGHQLCSATYLAAVPLVPDRL